MRGGPWSGTGEAEEQRERIATRLARYGEEWIAPEQGIRTLARLVREDVGTSVVAFIDWSALPVRAPWLAELVGREEDRSSTASDDFLRRLRELAPRDRRDGLIRFLGEQLIEILRLRTAPPPSAGFFELGMDSLMAVELRNRLNRAFRGAFVVSNTAVFDHPDIARLAGTSCRPACRRVAGDASAEVLGSRPAPRRRTHRNHRLGLPIPRGTGRRGVLGAAWFRGRSGDEGASGRALRGCGNGIGPPLRRLRRGSRPLRCGLLPDRSSRGGTAGSPAADVARDELGGA